MKIKSYNETLVLYSRNKRILLSHSFNFLLNLYPVVQHLPSIVLFLREATCIFLIISFEKKTRWKNLRLITYKRRCLLNLNYDIQCNTSNPKSFRGTTHRQTTSVNNIQFQFRTILYAIGANQRKAFQQRVITE